MLLTCTCGATNRVPSILKTRLRCGKCRHEFTPSELTKAQPEAPPDPFELDVEDDLLEDDDDPYGEEEE